jgi:hypothetical protein
MRQQLPKVGNFFKALNFRLLNHNRKTFFVTKKILIVEFSENQNRIKLLRQKRQLSVYAHRI